MADEYGWDLSSLPSRISHLLDETPRDSMTEAHLISARIFTSLAEDNIGVTPADPISSPTTDFPRYLIYFADELYGNHRAIVAHSAEIAWAIAHLLSLSPLNGEINVFVKTSPSSPRRRLGSPPRRQGPAIPPAELPPRVTPPYQGSAPVRPLLSPSETIQPESRLTSRLLWINGTLNQGWEITLANGSHAIEWRPVPSYPSPAPEPRFPFPRD